MRVALTAAQTALAALQAAPKQIQQHISIDIALHVGDVAYGNIGSGNRLELHRRWARRQHPQPAGTPLQGRRPPLLMTDTFRRCSCRTSH